jgi:hypothetical protein
MTVLFYESAICKQNVSPGKLLEYIYLDHHSDSNNKLECISDFDYPQQMSIRLVGHDGIPYCTIITDHEEYDMFKALAKDFVTFPKTFAEQLLEGE